jgi:hypothetical protein
VDAVETSDELLLGLMESHEVIGVRYQQRKNFFQRLYPVPVLASGHLLNIKARAHPLDEILEQMVCIPPDSTNERSRCWVKTLKKDGASFAKTLMRRTSGNGAGLGSAPPRQ